MHFKLVCEKMEPDKEVNKGQAETKTFLLDTKLGRLWIEEDRYIGLSPEGKLTHIEAVMGDNDTSKIEAPWKEIKKSKNITKLKIQMGLSCNFSCSYCSQKYVERPVQGNPEKVDELIESVQKAFDLPNYGKGLHIEFWGGEPFVYWKTMKPLAEKLRYTFPGATFSVITNGSLLTKDIVDWLDAYGFTMSISHDGPGQHVRGPDPIEDNEEAIRYAVEKMHRKGKGSFGTMLNRDNISRVEVQKWFDNKFGPGISIGEGGMVEAYDEDGFNLSLQTKAEHFEFRRVSLQDILGTYRMNFSSVEQRIKMFMSQLVENHTLGGGMKCGMDREDVVTIDMFGNVITCQNTSAAHIADNGQPHLSGNISDLANVKVTAATHWADRPHCQNCPVVPVCRGACMYIYGDNWWKTCDNQFSDNIVMLAMAVLQLTGYLPVYIDADHLPDHRKDIWGSILEHKEKPVKKVFSIKAA